jgi:hypothetical protein
MSIISTLALMITGFVAKQPVKVDPRDAEIAQLKTQVDDLRSERDRWMDLAEAWRGRYYGSDSAMQQVAQAQAQAQQLMAYSQQAQAAQMLAQQPQYQQDGLINQAFYNCNCVPARHDMFLGANALSNPRE